MTTRDRRVTPLGREGIALPLALLGLVVVTLLVTTVLLTSGTEFAVSAAQRDASRSLYDANGALEQDVATRAQAAAASTRFVEGTAATAFNGVDYTLSLVRVSRVKTVDTPTQTEATDTWSVIASPTLPARGRGVGALVEVTRSLSKLVLNVSAGATSGGDFSVGGNSTISNGRSGQVGCANGDTVASSIQVTAGAEISQSGSAVLEGRADTSATVRDSLMNTILGRGVTLDTLAKYANIKFGARLGRPEWANNVRPSQAYDLTTTDSVYNWGCPQADMVNTVTCTAASAARFVVVAIDATNLNNQGGLSHAVTLNGDYGQGILVILNGSLNVQGNFIFRGIILVDQDLSIGGGAGGNNFSGKVEGTVVSFGSQSTVEDNVNGTATIRYNKCSIVDAQNALNNARLDDMPQVLANSTFAWYELVR
jgi:Tfp pilus assembly protein PilX